VEVNEREEEEKREVERVLYDDLDLGMREDEFVERVWKVWSMKKRKRECVFLYEQVICRRGLPQRFVMDNGSDNQDITKSLLEHYNVKNINISAYHPQSNGLIEQKKAQWNLVLPWTLWVDRVTLQIIRYFTWCTLGIVCFQWTSRWFLGV
jgi:hypothetical protein